MWRDAVTSSRRSTRARCGMHTKSHQTHTSLTVLGSFMWRGRFLSQFALVLRTLSGCGVGAKHSQLREREMESVSAPRWAEGGHDRLTFD